MEHDEFRAGVDAIAEQCIAARLRVLNRSVTGIYDEALRPLGLRIGQLNLLVAIARMGEAQPAVLSRMFHMDASTLSRNVDRMRQRGWLSVCPGEDGRTLLLSLTDPGKDVLQSAMAAWHTAQQRASELLGQSGVAVLHELARAVGRTEGEV